MCREPALQRPLAQHREGPHRRVDALQRQWSEVVELEIVAGQASGEIRDHDLAGLRDGLEAGGKVWRLSHHRFLLRRSCADEVAHHDQARGDTDPAGQWRAAARQRCHGPDDGEPRSHGPLGFVFVRPRPALLSGAGQVWMADIRFEIVSLDVPTTNTNSNG
jgi:hypothetical protein